MAISPDIIENILLTADIVEVVGEYVSLKKAGVNYKGVCPFHGDKDASLVVSPTKRRWKCFGCGAGGNLIGFVMDHEHISFYEAAKIVAEKYNITIPERELSDEEKIKVKEKESLRICLEFAQEEFAGRRTLPEAAEYLKGRKISPEILQQYGAGFSPRQITWLHDLSAKKGYDQSLMQRAGLINCREDKKIFDRFINRITFPFYSISGQIIGFTGRALEKESECKYLNSPNTELFQKGKVLFGIFQAKRDIAAQDKCYLVEGQFDVLSFVQVGFANTVCGSGTAFTQDQARLIKKLSRNVTLVYDGDSAGVKASIRNTDILLAEGMNVRAVALPEGEDPDTFARKMGQEKLQKYLKKKEIDFISFIYKAYESEMEDPIRKTEILRNIALSISVVPDKLQQQSYIAALATKFKADGELITSLVRECGQVKKQEVTVPDQPGFTGLDDAVAFLIENTKEVTLTWSLSRFMEEWGEKPTVLVTGIPDVSDVQDLRRVSPYIRCRDRFEINDELDEPDEVTFLANLSKTGFNVTMSRYERRMEEVVDDKTGETKNKRVDKEYAIGFNEFYFQLYARFSDRSERDKKEAVERCAELLSFADSTTRTLQVTPLARSLGVTKTAFEQVLKPFMEQRRNEARFNSDAMQMEGETLWLDSSKLPSYVEESEEINRMYRAFGFFPLVDSKGRKVAYVLKSEKKSFLRVGNFYIEPLLHVYDKESQANKRIVQLTQSNLPFPIYMEWVSKDMITLSSFRTRLWEEGDINFSNGTQQILDQITDSWAGKFRKCYELHTYGWYDEGFYSFSNAIVHEVDGAQQIQMVDDIGIVTHNQKNYYLPAFSNIYASERRDNDKFYMDRFVKYREPKAPINFKKWASLMDEVYKLNNNGKWAILFTFMSAFRSDIYEIDRIFTALFFIGPTGSGKSQIGYSIRSVFMPPEAPSFNLNSGTPAALFTLMERYRNMVLMLEEYNDLQIADIVFQTLKSAVYDGEGKQKRKDATSKDIDSSQVNAALTITGQESPQRDDNSLFNRVIICDVPKRDDRTAREEEVFLELKRHQDDGLHNVLLEILKLRKVVRNKYMKLQREAFKELKDSVRVAVTNTDGLSRILNTVSMFLGVCRLIEEETELELPFTYQEFFEVAKEKVIKQVESISTSNRMYTFFNNINYLIDTGAIKEGRDFKIESPGNITLQKKGRETFLCNLDPTDTRVLYLNLTNIYPQYNALAKKEALSLQSLNSYLESNEAYIGRVRSTRFRWKEVAEIPRGDMLPQPDGEVVTDNTMKRVMEMRESNTSAVVLNYDKLKELLSIDFERNVKEYEF